jgi:protein CWC15
MSTAHRPTWAPAKGHEYQGGNRLYFSSKYVSAKDIIGHTKLKRRQAGQGHSKELENINKLIRLNDREIISVSTNSQTIRKNSLKEKQSNLKTCINNNEFSTDLDEQSFYEETALLAELNSIKRAKKKIDEQSTNYSGNTIMEHARIYNTTVSPKQEWFEDTVFTNQSRGEKKPCIQFINDTVRKDAHKQFLERYLK